MEYLGWKNGRFGDMYWSRRGKAIPRGVPHIRSWNLTSWQLLAPHVFLAADRQEPVAEV